MSMTDILDDSGWKETRRSGLVRQVGGDRLLLAASMETGVAIAKPGATGLQGVVTVEYRDLAELTMVLGEMQHQLRVHILTQQAQAREALVRSWMDDKGVTQVLQSRAWDLMHHYSDESASRLIQDVARGGYGATGAEQAAAAALLTSQAQAGVS